MVIDVEDLLYVLTYFRLASSKGPLPELEYDGIKGKGTFRWTGPPAIVKTDSSYDIEYSEIYPGTAVQSSALTFITIHPVSLPHISDVAALTAYTFSITATLVRGSVTSGYANVTTKGRGRLIKDVDGLLVALIS